MHFFKELVFSNKKSNSVRNRSFNRNNDSYLSGNVQIVIIHENKENDRAGLNIQVLLLIIIWPTFRKQRSLFLQGLHLLKITIYKFTYIKDIIR